MRSALLDSALLESADISTTPLTYPGRRCLSRQKVNLLRDSQLTRDVASITSLLLESVDCKICSVRVSDTSKARH